MTDLFDGSVANNYLTDRQKTIDANYDSYPAVLKQSKNIRQQNSKILTNNFQDFAKKNKRLNVLYM